jgi:hypothetical protein
MVAATEPRYRGAMDAHLRVRRTEGERTDTPYDSRRGRADARTEERTEGHAEVCIGVLLIVRVEGWMFWRLAGFVAERLHG